MSGQPLTPEIKAEIAAARAAQQARRLIDLRNSNRSGGFMAETPKDTQEALEAAGRLQKRDQLMLERQELLRKLENNANDLRAQGFEPESQNAQHARRNVVPDKRPDQ